MISTRRLNTLARFGLMAMGMLALLSGLWAGLLRLGWAGPLLQATLPSAHGPLMVSGFLGTLISLERAVALDRTWAFLAPAATGIGGILTLAGVGGAFGPRVRSQRLLEMTTVEGRRHTPTNTRHVDRRPDSRRARAETSPRTQHSWTVPTGPRRCLDSGPSLDTTCNERQKTLPSDPASSRPKGRGVAARSGETCTGSSPPSASGTP